MMWAHRASLDITAIRLRTNYPVSRVHGDVFCGFDGDWMGMGTAMVYDI